MAYISRGQSGLGAMDTYTTSPANRRDFAAHWDGGPTPTTAAGELSLLRGYDAYHRSKDWGGLGYNLAAGPVTGNVYEGRGLDAVGAAVANHNTPTISCILIGGPGNLTPKGKQALKDAYALANRHVGRSLGQKAHRDFGGTDCPGDAIATWVHAGGLSGGNIPTGGGGPSDLNPNAYHPTYIRQVQELLIGLGYSCGPDGADGILGQNTFDAVVRFQKAVGLDPDGIPGPDTLAALRRGGSTTPVPQGKKLDIDRIIGFDSITRAQQILGTTADGYVDDQLASIKPYMYTFTTIRYGSGDDGSSFVIALQRRLIAAGYSCGPAGDDGLYGIDTIKAHQRALGVEPDAYFGPTSAEAFQIKLNQGKVF